MPCRRDLTALVTTTATLVALAVGMAAPASATASAAQERLVIDTAVGVGDGENSGDGRLAVQASVDAPKDVATAPDGTLYVLTDSQIRAVDPKTRKISTFAGTGKEGFSGDGGPATEAELSGAGKASNYGASGLAVGSDGTVYVADAGNHRIRAIDPDTKKIRTVAGSGKTGSKGGEYGGDGGPATKAKLYYPRDVAVDDKGNLYIADYLNYRVRMVTAKTGRIRTVAGMPHAGDSGSGFFPQPDDENGKATGTFVEPDGIAVGNDRTVYFTESEEDRVQAVDVGKDTIRTVAGDGATSSYLDEPSGLAVSHDGKTVYVAAQDVFDDQTGQQKVYALDLAKKRLRPFAGGGDGRRLGDRGKPTEAVLAGPGIPGTIGLAAAKNGDVYIADQQHHRVRVVTERSGRLKTRHRAAAEDIRTLVGSGNELDEEAEEELDDREDKPYYRDVHELDEVDLDRPGSVAVGDDGTLYIADAENFRIRAVSPDDGVVRTIAGQHETPGYDETSGDGGKATDAYLEKPGDLALGPDRKLYFTDTVDDEETVRVVDLDEGTIDTAPGAQHEFQTPSGIAVTDDGTVYVVDSSDNRVCRLRPAQDNCQTIASSESAEGDAEEFLSPTDIAAAPDGMLYVTDTATGRVHSVDPKTGGVTTVAGYRVVGADSRYATGDGARATSATLGTPSGIVAGEDGWLYITDEANHRVRAIHLTSGVIRAVAGTGKFEDPSPAEQNSGISIGGGEFGGDGGPAGKAKLNMPSDVAVGPDGELYVADTGNNRIRVIGDTTIEPGTVIHPLVWIIGGLALAAALGTTGFIYHRRRRKRIVTATNARTAAAAEAEGSEESSTEESNPATGESARSEAVQEDAE